MASQPVEAEPRRAGRPPSLIPPSYSDQTADEIIQRLTLGESMSSICRDDRMPHHSTVIEWEDRLPDFAERSLRARERGTHAIADQCLAISDDLAIDPGHKRIMVDTRLRLIGQWNRKVYGQSLQVDGELRISIKAALAQANARVIEGTSTRITTSSDEPSPDDDL